VVPLRIPLEGQRTTHNERPSAITPELEAEFEEAVRQAMSGERDSDAMRRAAERMDRVRGQTYRKHELLDIGVPAIRELRGEPPESHPFGRAVPGSSLAWRIL
jgi:hypothetical protein